MKNYLPLNILIFQIIFFHFLLQTSGAQENLLSEVSNQQDASWTELVFKGSKLMTNITVKIQLSSADQLSGSQSPNIGTGLDDCSKAVTGDKVLTVQSSSKGVGSSGQYEEEVWFDGKALHPGKRIRLSGGNDPWVKSYCWEDNGVRRLKIFPGKSSEKKHPPSKWTKRSESFYEYPVDSAGCATILDPSVVFYMLTTLDLSSQKEAMEICVFGRKQLHRVTIRQEKNSSLKVAYKERSASGEGRVKDKITPVVFSISTKALPATKQKPEAYSFLGLNKDIRIFMDPEKRLPVKIIGTNNSIGELVLDLKVQSK